jgi:isoquinoline 1-oxidoreductase beta subunit
MPLVEAHIVAEGAPMGGIGEPGTPPIAPAACNALFVLTGKPVRRLSIVKETWENLVTRQRPSPV